MLDDEGYERLTSVLNDTTSEAEAPAQNHGVSQDVEQIEPPEYSTEVEAVGKIEERVAPKVKQAQGQNFSLYSAVDFYYDETTVEYLIDNIVQREGYHMFYGDSENGKSFLMLDIAASIACPHIQNWCGKDIEHGGVFYFVGESAKGMKKRFRCWCDTRSVNPESVQLTFCDTQFKLDNDKDKEHCVEEVIKTVRTVYDKPALLIFDTVNVFMKGNENDNSDAGNFNGVCKRLIQELGCAVAIVHHTGLASEAKTRGRGASAFRGGMDIEFRVENSNGVITLTQTKNKENEKEKPLLFNLTAHVIEGLVQKNGEPVTSCTVEYSEKLMESRENQEAKKEAERQMPKLSDGEFFALDTYREAAITHGKIVVDDETTGHETIWVDVEDWRETYYRRKTDNTDSAREKAFNRAKKALAEAGTKHKFTFLKLEREGGHEYYLLDLSSSETESAYRIEIREGIKSRAAAAEPDDETTKAVDTTGNLF